MQKKAFVLLLASSMLLGGCGEITYPQLDPLEGDYVANFEEGEQEEMFASDGWSNGLPFNAVWKKENVTYSNGEMHLSIKDEEATADNVTYPHTAGEARSHKLYGYGDFEVRMKITNLVGSVATFFTYTDEWNSTNGVPNKHDEIDIEFLGKDPTKVQFNYFANGQGGHEHFYNLGFDASKEFHNYGFRWEEDCISWFVDGKTVYQVKKDAKNPVLPSMPGRILSSYWPCSVEGWAGKFDHANEDTIDYKWIKSNAPTSYADGEEPVVPPEPVEEFDWDNVTPTDLDFATGSSYTVSKTNGVTTATYNSAGAWGNLTSSIADVANANDTINLTLKNNGPTKSIVRVDVQGTTKVGNTDCLNTSAAAEGHTEIYTDMSWGGSKIELASNEEVEFIISYDVTGDKGLAKMLLIFIDSLQDNMVAHEGGSVSISKIKFAKFGDWTPVDPETPPEPPVEDPEDPAESAFWASTNVTDLSFNATSSYTVAKDNGVTTVTYSGAGNWENVSSPIADVANTFDTVKITLYNKNSTESSIRVDIKGENSISTGESSSTDCLNVHATVNGADIYTDTTWGGSSFTLAAYTKVDIIVNYDTSTTKGSATHLLVYLDSTQSGVQPHAGGHIEISRIKFASLA